MAELFNFTGSQNQVRPQSPTANAVANTQAADTFKSLSNLFGTAIDASNTIKQREKAAEVEASAKQSASLGSSIMGILTTNLTGTVLSSFAGTSATGATNE